MTAAAIRKLVKQGFTAEQIAIVAGMLERASVSTETETTKASTERVRKWRMKRSETLMKRDETPNVTPECNAEKQHPLPTPPSPLHPPSPTPSPGHFAPAHEEPEAEKPEKPRKNQLPFPPDVQEAIRDLFRRKESTPWTEKEATSARKLRIPAEQMLSDIALFREAKDAGWNFYRRDPLSLLNNWQTEVDRSRDYLDTLENQAPAPQYQPRQRPLFA